MEKYTLRVAVCTLCINDWYEEIVKYGVKTIQNYAEKHGYDFFVCNDVYQAPDARDYPWYKIKAVQKILPDYDIVFWIDADGHVLKPEISVEDFIRDYLPENQDLLCTKDWNSTLNTGLMIIRNTPFIHALLYTVWNNKENFDPNFHEQASLGQIYDANRLNSQEKIRILPIEQQNVLFTYWSNYYPNDSFFIHVARCSHDRHGFLYTLDCYCPIKMDEDTTEEYEERLEWLSDEEKCRKDIELWIDHGTRTRPSTRSKLYNKNHP